MEELFAEGEAVEFSVVDGAEVEVSHGGRKQADGGGDGLGSLLEKALDEWNALVNSGDDLLGLVADDDFAAGASDSDHLLESSTAVTEEIDASDVKDQIERVVAEGEALGFSLIERSFSILAA